MTPPPLTISLLTILLLTKIAHTWTFVWRNESGPNVIHESKPAKCVRIYHEKGEEFSWDPEGAWCLRIWGEATCENMIGWECEHTRWRRDASRNLSAYDVYVMPKDAQKEFITETRSTSTSTSSSTETGTTTTTTAKDAQGSATKGSSSATRTGVSTPTPTSTSDADSDDDSSSGSLSGGAIAGIVIGAIAGVTVLATIFFLWGRQKPPSVDESGTVMASDTAPQAMSADPRSGSGYDYSHGGVTGSSNGPQMTEATTLVPSSDGTSRYADGAHVYRPPGTGLPVELPGEMGGVELSNSRQLMEMDGAGYVKRSSSIAKE
ncbi:EGFR-like transmembrane domain-containing protein [Aspergillus affinis]|uniref:EGFR-like transmembrane domain-containing protein n=1 Tax=Aspergillus affinis TaxID=1070780 RepID=UPI0022FE3467|nr:uncharacterized protein KD926_005127 [Aspergillus affinis]KAI9042797.1 hypothetical protein KD926_005127 [Aspergillus affinis]